MHKSVEKVIEIDPTLKTGLLYDDVKIDIVNKAKSMKVDAIHPSSFQLQLIGNGWDKSINVWNVDNEMQLESCINKKVSAIMTNYPDAMRNMLKNRKI